MQVSQFTTRKVADSNFALEDGVHHKGNPVPLRISYEAVSLCGSGKKIDASGGKWGAKDEFPGDNPGEISTIAR